MGHQPWDFNNEDVCLEMRDTAQVIPILRRKVLTKLWI
jgi:hypothetical protein